MQRVLRKRVLRDLKTNFFRYFALGLMIAMGIFLVVTIVGNGETLTRGTEDIAEETNLEDGEFEVFVPLSKKDKSEIADMGIEISEQFYFDYVLEDEDKGTVRIFKVRDKINKIHYIEGKAPADAEGIVLEKRYAEEHDLKVGDSFDIAGTTYNISGIGVVSDYDAPFKELGDTSCNSKSFGPVFVTDEAYESFKNSGKTQKSEDYIYAYKLGGGKTDDDLKDYLKDLKIDSTEVDDELFQEYWDRTGGVEEELRDAVKELRDATDDVRDGLDELSENNEDINDATADIFDAYLEQTSSTLQSKGINIELTENNFETKLDDLIDATDNAFMKVALKDTKKELSNLKDYKDGLKDYTDGVDELYDGLDDMSEGVGDLDEAVDDTLEEFDFSLSNLTMFLKQSDNPRIFGTKNDKAVDIEVGIIAGVIIFILLAYVISVFVVHSIESESSIIGTLYSMGVTKNDLMTHYITLPVVVTFLGGLIGALVASTGIMAPMIAESSYSYFSIPQFDFSVPSYLWVYSVAVPPLIAVVVNVIVIRSKLNRTALSLIRNEVKQSGIKKVNLKGMNFVSAFRIRQMLCEMRSTLAVVMGMLLSLLVFMIGVNCYVLCENIAKDYEKDTKFEYMYNLKYPEEEPPKDAEPAYAYTCRKNTLGYNFDVTILGIEPDSKYFDVEPGDSKSDVVVSNAFAEKFGIKEGEEFVVTDEDKELKYAFTVKEITEYSTSFYIFMDIDVMRDMMGESDDYYNVLFTDKKIDIDPGRVYTTISKDDVVNGASVFSSLMMPMVYTLSFSSAIIFCVVLYLMMKVMVDRSAYNISLIKVFGYRRKEVRKLYLDGNFYIIALGALICLPLSKVMMNKLFPFMISNVSCGLNVGTPIIFFVVAYIVILILYFVINTMLVSRLNKFTPAEVLKNRE
ncbi:putative ABC transport system permease protein [Lachnospiraceae bacterium NE2001]|nr:putative ABC transport system permease protein [Lachnospiraceae bacterium NE2001]